MRRTAKTHSLKNFARKLLEENLVTFIGSDAHDLRWRTTDIDMFIRDYPEDLEDLLYTALRENPEKLLNNEEIVPERLGFLADY